MTTSHRLLQDDYIADLEVPFPAGGTIVDPGVITTPSISPANISLENHTATGLYWGIEYPRNIGAELNISLNSTSGQSCFLVQEEQTPFNQSLNAIIQMADPGDWVSLMAFDDKGDMRWRIVASDGIALT